MRGASYEFGYMPRRRKGSRIRFWALLLAFAVATFFLVLKWPDNWDDILVSIIHYIRFM